MNFKRLSHNAAEITQGEVAVLFSYETPVAAIVRNVGAFRTSKRWSITTQGHITKWLRDAAAPDPFEVSQEIIGKIADGSIDADALRAYADNRKSITARKEVA